MNANEPVERNLGEQPIARLMAKHRLEPKDLVRASTEQLTHKMVSRACKGRRLNPHVQEKVRRAFNCATQQEYTLLDLFSYCAGHRESAEVDR